MSWRGKLNTYLHSQKNYERFQPLKLHDFMFATSQFDEIISPLSQDFRKTSHGANFKEEVHNGNAHELLGCCCCCCCWVFLAFLHYKNFKLTNCLGRFHLQILLNLLKYALFVHTAPMPCRCKIFSCIIQEWLPSKEVIGFDNVFNFFWTKFSY